MGSFASPNLAQALHEQVKLLEEEPAVKCGSHSLTYQELHSKATGLANEILRLQLPAESPIAVLAPRDINHVLAQVAIIYAGGTCVPLDLKQADKHLSNLLDNLGCRLILSDADNQDRLKGYDHVVVRHEVNLEFCLDRVEGRLARVDGPAVSHIYHTSGTTGKPKAVQVPTRGLLNCAYHGHFRVERGQRVGHVGAVSFDMSLFEIWVTLLSGGCVTIVPHEVVLDPLGFAKRIRSDRIDFMFLTPALLAVTVNAMPDAFARLHTLLTGGEAMNLQTIRAMFQHGAPQRLVNVYGPTETTIYCLYHQVTFEDVQADSVPLGRAIGNMAGYVVDSELRPVAAGQVGELLLQGEGVSRGYFGEAQKTALVFVDVDHLDGQDRRYYRTGDMVRADPTSGEFWFVGRRDNQVKIRGQRIELEAVELELRHTGLVRDAAVVRVQPDGAGAAALLVAFVIPHLVESESKKDAQAKAIVREYAARSSLMVPRIEFVDVFPLKTTGKVDRHLLEQQYLARLRAITLKPAATMPLINRLEMLWLHVLCLPVVQLDKTADFFADLGGTSLQAAALMARMSRAFSIELPSAALYEHPTLQGLASVVERLQAGEAAGGGKKEAQRKHDADEALWAEDCRLAHSLRPAQGPLVDWMAPGEGRVLLTGATGFVGAFLLVQLLKTCNVQRVACLIRARDEASAWARLRSNLAKYGIPLESDGEQRVLVVPGDFGKPRLGLHQHQYELLASWASVVFHLGAHVNYVQPYSHHRTANVLGTLHMLHFASHGRSKQMHYSSSIAAYGPSGYVLGSTTIAEDHRPDAHMKALHYDTGYSQSQMVAETLVWNAADNGLPVAIFRPGFVVGHSRTGISNPDDFVGRLFASCLQMGCHPVLRAQRKEFIPVDFVVDAMLAIAQNPRRLGRAYNLVQPRFTDAIDLDTAFALLKQVSRVPLRPLPYKQWVQCFSLETHDPLHPLMPMLQEKVLDNRTRWEVQENMATFGTLNLRAALREDAPRLMQCEPMSLLFERYLDQWLQPRT